MLGLLPTRRESILGHPSVNVLGRSYPDAQFSSLPYVDTALIGRIVSRSLVFLVHGPDRGLEIERVHYDETLRSKDRLEALAAFAEKRKPTFAGA